MNSRSLARIDIEGIETEEIEKTYNGLLGQLKELSGKKDRESVQELLSGLIDFVIERLSAEDESLLLYSSKIFDEDYVFVHALNVCLISVRIGQRLRFPKKRLKNLGRLALAHAKEDMGLPEGLTNDVNPDREMEEIVRLADVYDALTHPPDYRQTMLPDETLKSIIDSESYFDRRLVKILLEELSLYPRGSWVQLSTQEIGKVIKVNKGQLLRPLVKIYIDGQGRNLKEPAAVDLSKKNLVYVLRPLTLKDLERIAGR